MTFIEPLFRRVMTSRTCVLKYGHGFRTELPVASRKNERKRDQEREAKESEERKVVYFFGNIWDLFLFSLDEACREGIKNVRSVDVKNLNVFVRGVLMDRI